MPATPVRFPRTPDGRYILDEQVGFILRQVSQRHASIFADRIGADLTPTQWATLAKLAERGTCSQNLLGRHTAMDAATIKGVVGRLSKRGLVETRADSKDARRIMVGLTEEGRRTVERVLPDATAITEATLAPLANAERETLLQLLAKLR
jgi:DNA-binding MarR family transcriptional regulator